MTALTLRQRAILRTLHTSGPRWCSRFTSWARPGEIDVLISAGLVSVVRSNFSGERQVELTQGGVTRATS